MNLFGSFALKRPHTHEEKGFYRTLSKLVSAADLFLFGKRQNLCFSFSRQIETEACANDDTGSFVFFLFFLFS